MTVTVFIIGVCVTCLISGIHDIYTFNSDTLNSDTFEEIKFD